MKRIFLLLLFLVAGGNSFAQFKTTFTHDVNGNRVANVTTAQSGEIMSNTLAVQSLVGSQATFKWQTVPTVSNYVYEYSTTPTRFSTNATSVAITVPTADYFQFVVSNNYANNRCVVGDWVNFYPPKCNNTQSLFPFPDDIVYAKQYKVFSTAQTVLSESLVNTNGQGLYTAGNSITLNPGFKADNGTIFKAEIRGCN